MDEVIRIYQIIVASPTFKTLCKAVAGVLSKMGKPVMAFSIGCVVGVGVSMVAGIISWPLVIVILGSVVAWMARHEHE